MFNPEDGLCEAVRGHTLRYSNVILGNDRAFIIVRRHVMNGGPGLGFVRSEDGLVDVLAIHSSATIFW